MAKASASSVESDYQFLRTLGKGGSCRVVEAIDKKNGGKYAVKIMSKSNKICSKLYNHEIKILSMIDHKNILKLIKSFETKTEYYIITSLLTGGELFDRIVSTEFNITEKYASSLIRDMLLSLQYLHSKNIIHRDLKPENFVFENNTINSPIVLIDFGCAKIVDDNKEYKDLVGTAFYLSPELAMRSTKRTGLILKSSDIWSIGVITYVMLTGRAPFNGKSNKEIFYNIINKQLKYPKDVQLSNSLKDFINKSLKKDPLKRITMSEALNHPWVQGKDATDKKVNKEILRYLRQFNYQSKLKKAITRVLAVSMASEPEKEVRNHFIRLDVDRDGFLDANELELLLKDMGYAPSEAKVESKKMLIAADVNNDNVIDFNEFKQVWQRRLLSNHDKYIHGVFGVFDDNGDGFIDAKELQSVLGDEFDEIKNMIKEVDKNSDGKLSFDEFKDAMKEKVDEFTSGFVKGAGFKDDELFDKDEKKDE